MIEMMMKMEEEKKKNQHMKILKWFGYKQPTSSLVGSKILFTIFFAIDTRSDFFSL